MPIRASLIAWFFLTGCLGSAEETTGARQAEVALDGDRILAAAAEVLSREPGVSFRYALDRATNEIAELNVEPYPESNCSGRAEQEYWNGADDSLARLGMVGVADVVALESVSFVGYPGDHVWLLRRAPGEDADARRALDILTATGSPAMILSAVQALTQNPALSEGAFRALLAHQIDLYETKAFRGADGALRLPDFAHPPSASALLDRLQSSPVTSYRATAVRAWDRWGAGLPATRVDALLDDPQLAVRVETGRLFWRGSDTSPARQQELVDWFSSPEGRRQIRAAVLLERHDLSEDEATAWTAEPDGFGEQFLESVGSFVGGALETAPADADVRVLLTAATHLPHITDIAETAARAAFRANGIGAADREALLLALLRMTDADEQPHANAYLWRTLAGLVLEKGASAAVMEAFRHDVYVPAENRPAIEAQLVSPEHSTRLAGIEATARFSSGFRAAVFDAGRGDEALLEHADEFVFGAALDGGVRPQAILDRVLGFARVSPGEPEPVLQFWQPREIGYLDAFERALDDPSLPAGDRRDAIVTFGKVIHPNNTVGPVGGAPGMSIRGTIARILGRLDDGQLDDETRLAAWREILEKPDGKLRHHLLYATPTDPEMRTLLADLVRPRILVTATTCWQGHANAATERPAISISLVPYLMTVASDAIDPVEVVSARADAVRRATADAEDLGDAPTLETIFSKRPHAKNAYFGAWSYDTEQRSIWESSAEALATRLIAATGWASIDALVHGLGYAVDYPSLPEARLLEVEAALDAHVADARGRAIYGFFLRAMRGTPYDELADRFRTTVALRWDLADATRPRGQEAALETLLASVGTEFGLPSGTVTLAAESVTGADVSASFREGLLELGASGTTFWSSWGQWSTGTIPLARAHEPSLDFVLRVAPIVTAAGSAPNEDLRRRQQMFGTIARDRRLSAPAATQLAWITLVTGTFREGFTNGRPIVGTSAIDMVLAIHARDDVSVDEKRALGRALLATLQ